MYLKNKSQTFLSLGHLVIAFGTLSLSLAYTTLKRIFCCCCYFRLFVCLFFRSAELCNQIIECSNVLISIEIGYSLFELMYDTVMIDTSAFIVTKV